MDMPKYRNKRETSSKSLLIVILPNAKQLVNTFILIDSRHNPQDIDVDFINALGAQQHPFSIVFTKIDKLSNAQRQNNISVYKSHLLKQGWESTPPLFESSAKTGEGRNEILSYIESINSNL